MKRIIYVLVIILLHSTCLHCVGQGLPSTSFSQRIHELGLNSISCDYSLNTSFSIPTPSCAYVDSMERIEEWIDTRFELIDSYLGYMEDVSIQAPANEECYASGCAGVYDMQGRKVTTPKKSGIYIKNGKKFFVH